MNAASLATMLAGLPFEGPVGSVRIGLIGGEWVINPTFQEVEEATFDIVVAGRRNDAGEVDILMIEGEAPDNTWELLAAGAAAPDRGGRRRGPRGRQARDRRADRLPARVHREADVTDQPFEPRPLYGDDLYEIVAGFAKERLETAIVPDKAEREAKLDVDQGRAEGAPAAELGRRRRRPQTEISPRGRTCRRRSCARA